MQPITDNMQKYNNYKEQMNRLKKAINSEFYLEAISIEYAIVEDRVTSALRHAEKFNPEKHNSLNKKLNRLKEMQRAKTGKKPLLGKYISDDLIASIDAWKSQRNTIIHALLNQSLHTEDLREEALQGLEIVKILNSKVSSWNRALEREKQKV